MVQLGAHQQIPIPTRFWNIDPTEAGQPENNLDWIVMANDRNGETKLGKVERTVTSIPNHIDGLQTIQEYLYPASLSSI